ncbi:ABC transporter permease [Parafilimonas sp.]|uniref:ABC transporter permease n=1 Tax=Parafilimonas sp. TaxID=1969739 RepID=UPI0039E27D3D
MARNKAVTFINIAGLALGMAVSIIISLWIWRELSFDKNFAGYKTISQVMLTGTFSGEVSTDAGCPVPLAGELKNRFGSDFKQVALTSKTENHILVNGDAKLTADGVFAQPGFIDMLSVGAVKGSVKTLDDPSSIIISTSLAKSLFGNKDAVGKIIKTDNKDNLKIAGVYNDFPSNSSFADIKYIGSWSYFMPKNDEKNDAWNVCWYNLYVQLNNGVRNDDVLHKIAGLMSEHLTDIKPVLLLHPMEKWHLHSTFTNGVNTGGQVQYVWMFGLIGFFVLLLACINFMNLSTARSGKRAKEVGILKTIGSGRKQLVFRFLGESIITTIIAFIISILLVQMSLPWFNSFIRADITIPFNNIYCAIACIVFVLATGIAAGLYPAFYLSSFKPVKVLKGGFQAGRAAAALRKILVVVQFFTSIFLITATLIVLKQLNYARSRPLGYSANGLINIAIKTPELQTHYNAFRNDLLQSGAAVNVAASSAPVNQLKLSAGGYSWDGLDPDVQPVFGTVSVTEDFANTVQWRFIKGRNFSRSFITDSSGVILNRKALDYMGLQNVIGKQLDFRGNTFTILGVIDDAIMGSPFSSVIPTAFFLAQQPMSYITAKLSPSIGAQQALKKVETVFKQYSPAVPFDYSFVDEDYAKQFRSVETTGTLAAVFAVLAIIISGLGLYALASFMAEQRIKEIGIRKVLGASVAGLWKLLTGEFVLLNGIAFLLAVPVVWWSMHEWLNGYAYRTTISWQVFAFAAAITVVITLLTISFQAIKAAMANPVKSLRTE